MISSALLSFTSHMYGSCFKWSLCHFLLWSLASYCFTQISYTVWWSFSVQILFEATVQYVCIHWRFPNWVVSVYKDWKTQSLKFSSGLLLNNKDIQISWLLKIPFVCPVFLYPTVMFSIDQIMFFFLSKYL